MSRLLAAATLAATLSGQVAAQTVEEPPQRLSGGNATWHWRTDGTPEVVVAIARGDVRVVRSASGGVDVRASSPDPERDGSVVRLVVTEGGGRVRVVDRYPAVPPPWLTRECLPDGEHGALWSYPDRVFVTVTAPPGLKVSATTMSGRVTGG